MATSYNRLERRIGRAILEAGGSKHRAYTRPQLSRKARKDQRVRAAASRRRNRGK